MADVSRDGYSIGTYVRRCQGGVGRSCGTSAEGMAGNLPGWTGYFDLIGTGGPSSGPGLRRGNVRSRIFRI